jgi:HEAT repeat protein
MDHPVTFAKHFAQLVRLVEESADVVAQKAALRSCLVASKRGAVALSNRGDELVAGGLAVPSDVGVTMLARRIAAHELAAVVVDAGPAPADVLALARWLVAPPGTSTITDLKTVRAESRDPGSPGPQDVTPILAGRRPSKPARRRSGLVEAKRESTPAPRRKSGTIPLVRSGKFPAITGPQGHRRSGVIPTIDLDALETPWGRLLLALNDAATPEIAERIVGELVALAEAEVRDGTGDAAAEVAAALLLRAGEARTAEIARAYEEAVRRLTIPTTLTLMVQAARVRSRADVVLYVLRYAGEEGARAVIRQVMLAPTLADRRAHFEMLIKLPAAIPVLSRLLGDGRWHVARNAADLLGEMHASEAEEALVGALGHADERVRRAVAHALARLGTQKAVQSLQGALHDPSPLVRVQVVSGLAARKGNRSAGTLTEALDAEADIEVQLAILAALGRVATTEAVNRLIKAAEPDGRLFKKKPVAYRVAAVHALGDARTPAARAVLQTLANDKEREVRDAVLRVVVQSSRGESVDLA